jgi:hypothetical protein
VRYSVLEETKYQRRKIKKPNTVQEASGLADPGDKFVACALGTAST